MACRSKSGPELLPAKACASNRRLGPRGASIFLAGVVLLMLGATGCAVFAPRWHPLATPSDSPGILGRMQRHRITGDETLLDLTRRYDLGYVELLAANPGVDPWIPGQGTLVVLPTAHLVPSGRMEGIVINLAEQRLYVFPVGQAATAMSFPIGVSREGWTTPIGETRVVRKSESPIWYPTVSARREDPTLPKVVRSGPDNPLGDFALYLDWPRYLIHGTNEPDGVGRRVSRGCIRLYPEDIAQLFAITPVETPVRVIHEPVKLAQAGGHVYLEVHPTMDEMLEIEEKGRLQPTRPDDLRPRIRSFAGEASERVDWELADRTAAERRGTPVRITR